MAPSVTPKAPPFCPNSNCPFHKGDKENWRFVRNGCFVSGRQRRSTQRYMCLQCGRSFSDRSFRTTYWLRRPELLLPIARRLVSCAGFRQIARDLEVSPQTVARHAARLGRQALLFHEGLRKRRPVAEPVALDSFVSFEYSQFHPTHFHLVVGRDSHFCHGFTDSERRRSGSMTKAQRRRRADLEARLGRPDPRSVEKEVAALLEIVAAGAGVLDLYSDEDQAYPRAIRRLTKLTVSHRTISSRAARTTRNPLFAINLTDLLIRHSSANQKRETIAFSKRRQSAAERLWLFLAWRNCVKSFSEKTRGATPAQTAGITSRRWTLKGIFRRRRFPDRTGLPERWLQYFEGRTPTRAYGLRERIPPIYAY
jgi:transposase-like protein